MQLTILMKLRSNKILRPLECFKRNVSTVSRVKKLIERKKQRLNLEYLAKQNVVEWLFGDPKFVSSLTKEKEDRWGRELIGYNTNQWTTKLGESVLKEILLLSGDEPERIKTPLRGMNAKKLLPDFETKDALYENKARTYQTTGTAGEKILGTPLKYCECYNLYKKPLNIICMAYQEKEADESFHLFKPKSTELKKLLEFYEKEFKIKYVKATDMLKKLI
jgi:hypothetical protein